MAVNASRHRSNREATTIEIGSKNNSTKWLTQGLKGDTGSYLWAHVLCYYNGHYCR